MLREMMFEIWFWVIGFAAELKIDPVFPYWTVLTMKYFEFLRALRSYFFPPSFESFSSYNIYWFRISKKKRIIHAWSGFLFSQFATF